MSDYSPVSDLPEDPPIPRPETARRDALVQGLGAFLLFVGVRVTLELAGFIDFLEAKLPRYRIPVMVTISFTIAVTVTTLVLRFSKETFASIGAQKPERPWREIGRGLGIIAFTYIVQLPLIIAAMLLFKGRTGVIASRKIDTLEEFVAMPMWAILPVALMAGFYEELFVRGLLQRRFERVAAGAAKPNVWHKGTAIFVASTIFAAGHFYQGFFGVVQTFFVGLTFGLFAARWRSIWAVAAAHFLIDFMSLFAAHVLLPTARAALQQAPH